MAMIHLYRDHTRSNHRSGGVSRNLFVTRVSQTRELTIDWPYGDAKSAVRDDIVRIRIRNN
jgi:hypothetical protein